MNENLPFKSGFVSLAGRPNVGKSTLINHIMQQKIAAASPRPQTTQRRQLGILTLEDAQIIFIDTPGIHKPVHKLGDFMNETAFQTLSDADVIVWLVDASEAPHHEDRLAAERIAAVQPLPPLILALNKIDLLSPEQLKERERAFWELLPEAMPFAVSAVDGQGEDALLDAIIARLPEGPLYYEPDQITDLYEREIAADLIREALLTHLDKEVPHATAVRIDEFKERENNVAFIQATLYVERDSQKGILIGKGGSMIKQIGATARQAIEAMSGRKIYLDLRVKVHKNWRNNPDALQQFGFMVQKDE
ncbi:MAG: GTPase Era [Anaerolineaceae bacterium]|jgi:GTP-binding protein Era|nr:GTPase Era [Anaerolineaceae bacterium]